MSGSAPDTTEEVTLTAFWLSGLTRKSISAAAMSGLPAFALIMYPSTKPECRSGFCPVGAAKTPKSADFLPPAWMPCASVHCPVSV